MNRYAYGSTAPFKIFKRKASISEQSIWQLKTQKVKSEISHRLRFKINNLCDVIANEHFFLFSTTTKKEFKRMAIKIKEGRLCDRKISS